VSYLQAYHNGGFHLGVNGNWRVICIRLLLFVVILDEFRNQVLGFGVLRRGVSTCRGNKRDLPPGTIQQTGLLHSS
jgi:hypothetical protein